MPVPYFHGGSSILYTRHQLQSHQWLSRAAFNGRSGNYCPAPHCGQVCFDASVRYHFGAATPADWLATQCTFYVVSARALPLWYLASPAATDVPGYQIIYFSTLKRVEIATACRLS